MSRFITDDRTTFCTAMIEDESALGVRFGAEGKHQPSTGVRSIPGQAIHVAGCQTEWAVIAGSVSKRFYFAPALPTGKSAVIFGKAFLFHVLFPDTEVREDAVYDLLGDRGALCFAEIAEGALRFGERYLRRDALTNCVCSTFK